MDELGDGGTVRRGGGGVTVEGRTYGTLQEDGRGRWRDRMEND